MYSMAGGARSKRWWDEFFKVFVVFWRLWEVKILSRAGWWGCVFPFPLQFWSLPAGSFCQMLNNTCMFFVRTLGDRATPAAFRKLLLYLLGWTVCVMCPCEVLWFVFVQELKWSHLLYLFLVTGDPPLSSLDRKGFCLKVRLLSAPPSLFANSSPWISRLTTVLLFASLIMTLVLWVDINSCVHTEYKNWLMTQPWGTPREEEWLLSWNCMQRLMLCWRVVEMASSDNLLVLYAYRWKSVL